ncbi:peroxiredoxin [Flavobacterium lacus]|uniref:thioredoxin-dependent peroxiredoxin n=1 Tax=Flavobacterium lacus TaxID=1353778 RepID=A0A328WMX5_9FLAO|nr:peroxiredoxin [Flavobacterium lacus]RAR46635.1 peroxiredoxin Q/BCP [Flavobacterium lacus]
MALKVGDKVPDFTAKDSKGVAFDSSTVIGLKPTVIYFYPKDDTPGCTTQACSFRDQYQDFKELGAEVIGVSGDSVASHQKFAQKHQLPFILLSDHDKKLRNLFGVPTALFGLIPGRVTYVIDEKGIIRLVFDNLSGKIHIEKALQMLKKLV